MKVLIFLCTLLLPISSFAMDHTPVFSVETPIGKTFSMNEAFNGFGCTGKNISPEILWKNAPAGTKSFAVIIHDPDAPTQVGGWTHWVVFDIPATRTSLPANAGVPKRGQKFVQSITDFGAPGFGGPCPPVGHGVHHYHISVFALKTDKLGLNKKTNPATVGFYIWNNMIAKATTTVTFER